MGNGITSQVRAGDGFPIVGAALTLTDMTGNQVAHAMSTVDGRFDVDALPQGIYTAIFTAPGYAPKASTAMVSAGGRADLGVVQLDRVGGTDLPAPGVWTIDPVHSSITMSVRHLGFASIRGRFSEFSGWIEVGEPVTQSLVHARIDPSSIDTSNKVRDDHLRSADFLDVARFPEIEYTASEIETSGVDEWILRGDLTMKGISNQVDLALRYTGEGSDPWGGRRAAFHAEAELRRESFGITYNQVLSAGIDAIGATLRVEMDIEAVQGDSLPIA